MDKESPEEKLESYEIKKIEEQRLESVFSILAGKNNKIGLKNIMNILKDLHDKSADSKHGKNSYKPSKAEVELMIWEVDDDADGYVCKEEFIKMYKRCINDDQGLEPRKLFNLVYFLMFKPMYTGTVTEEDTLELLFVRYGREKLDDEIDAIFGTSERTFGYDDKQNFSEREITYPEYIKKVNQRAMDERKRKKEEKKNINGS